MRFTIHNEVALKALSKMCSIFPRRTFVELDAQENDLICTGIDSKYCFRCTIPATVVSSGKNTIDLHVLHDLLKNGTGNWTISCDESYTLEYSTASYTLPVGRESYEFIPTKEITWTVSGKTLSSIIKNVLIAAGDQIHNVVYIHTNQGKLTAAATDGRRLAYASSDGALTFADAEVILNKDAASLLSKWIEDDAEVSMYIDEYGKPMEIAWQKDSYVYILKIGTVQSRFPQYQAVVPQGGQSMTVNTQQLLSALQRIMVFSTNNHVILEPNNDTLTVKSSNIDIGAGSEFISGTFSTDAQPWCVDAKMLIPALSSETVTLQGEASGPIKINRPNFCYIFMPIARSRL
jgi:DNA polymerase III sliding clamp (beta) subunit (PCNA family)